MFYQHNVVTVVQLSTIYYVICRYPYEDSLLTHVMNGARSHYRRRIVYLFMREIPMNISHILTEACIRSYT